MDTTPAALHSLLCPVLIGRRSQLEALLHLIEQACAGHGHTVLIAGEAGIGKSRLVREAMVFRRSSESEATHPAVLTLQGHCFEQDSTLPYAPLLDLLRPFLASHFPEAGAASPVPVAPELVKLLPELATMLPEPAPVPALEPEQEKRRLHQALRDVFVHLSATQPLVLIVEDVHWSDDSSLEFLLFLARRSASHPILLLLTYRSGEEHPVFTRFLTELNRERLSTELQLSHLSMAEVGSMLRATLALERLVRSDLLETVYTLTEGTPFFIEEVLKSLATTGELVAVEGKWEYRPPEGKAHRESLRLPRSVQLAVQQRLDHLSGEARDVLSLAAVAGRRFDFPLLLAVTQREEAELVLLVKELTTAQLVVEELEDRFVFRHALTRQAVYTDLLARERRALHRLIAQTLERTYEDTLDAHLADLAYHYYAAREWNKVLLYAQRAGETARALYAPHAAIEQYTHALEAVRHLSLSPPLSLYRARGQCYELLGDFTAAHADYTRALEAARTTQDSQGEWQSLFDLGFLWTGREYEQAGQYLQSALSLARTMDNSPMLGQTLNRIGNWYVNLDRPQEGVPYHHEALTIFQALSDQRGLAETFDLLGMANYSLEGPILGAEYYEQAIALWRTLDDRQGLASSLAMMAVRGTTYYHSAAVWLLVSRAECVRDGEEALTLTRQLGWRSAEAFALIALGGGLGPRGDYAYALACAQAALDIAGEIEHEAWRGFAHLLLGILALDLLALPTARQHLEQALSLAKEMNYLYLHRITSGFLALACVAHQDFARAESLLKAEFSPAPPPRTAPQRLIWCAQAELELARGHADVALEIVEQTIASAAAVEQGGVILRLWHARALALLTLDRATEAETVLLAARAAARAHGARPMLWRVCVTLAKLSQAQARRKQAEEGFAEARTIIEELALNVPDEALREHFLRGATLQIPALRPPTPRQEARQAFGGLTAREREVARLVAQGKSNRALADALFLSERTIGKHIERIMTKLDCNSRAQIAAWAVEKGLVKHID
jgi:DNA-binding NarL/FixJ family response regulator